jgi:predicted Zn finger-like uncharacterized protein
VKIACPSCAAKYSIADDKVQNRLAKIRCRKCGTTIVIDGKTSPPTVQAAGVSSVHPQAASVSHAPAGSALPGGTVYTVDVGENDQRSMTLVELVDAYNSGIVAADTYVWQDGMADWAPLGEVPEINEALHAAANPGAASPAAAMAPAYTAPKVTDAAAGFSASAFSSRAASAPKEAARAATRADARQDLFGGIDTAGSEVGGSTQTVTTAATGARNESSVLFSLSALTADEKPRAAAPSGGRSANATTEDSGLIDLAALASAAEASSNAGLSMDLGPAPLGQGFGPLGAGPFGAAPLTGGTTSPLGGDGQPYAPAPSRTGLYIGGGIAVAAIVAGLVYLLKEEPPQAAIAAPPTTVIVTQIAAAPPPPVDSAQTAVAAADEEKKDEKNTATKPRPKSGGTGGGGKKPTPKDEGSKTGGGDEGAIKTEPKPKPKSKCNCAPSDLLCAMKCSTK